MSAGIHKPNEETLVMARYGELFLKSEPVKHHFIGMLLRNIRKALGAAGITCQYETPRGRILISTSDPERTAAIVDDRDHGQQAAWRTRPLLVRRAHVG